MGVGRYACFADFCVRPTAPRVMAVTGVAGMASFRGFQFERVGWGKCKTIDLAVCPTLLWDGNSGMGKFSRGVPQRG